jgi:hypothetical protein
MRKYIFLSLLFIIVVSISGCASNNGMSLYSFTEAELKSALQRELPKLSKQFKVLGMSVKYGVNDLNVDIGPEQRDVIALSFDSTAELNALIARYPIQMAIKVEGQPYYDSEKKAVFVRDVKLINSSIDAAGYKGSITAIDGQVLDIINGFLAVNPVYKLDTKNSNIALLTKLPIDMRVNEGAISLVPKI